jgi:MraZ protein
VAVFKMLGNYQARVDEKGRLKIPATFLEELREQGNQFFVTSENGEFVRIYPMRYWRGIEEKLAKLSSHNRTRQKYLARMNYYGQVVELDGQGRLLIQPVLREAAQMKGDVDVMGSLDYLDVWNHVRFLEAMGKNPMTEEDEKTLDELGI